MGWDGRDEIRTNISSEGNVIVWLDRIERIHLVQRG